MSTKARGRGNIHTRRNLAEFDANDPYTPHFDPGETAVCTECHALYERRHWFFDEEAYFYASMQPDTHKVLPSLSKNSRPLCRRTSHSTRQCFLDRP